MSKNLGSIAFLVLCLASCVTAIYENNYGQHVRDHRCPRRTPRECNVDTVAETRITCNELIASAAAAVDPQLYGGGYGVHLVPMAHRYYYSRMNHAFGSCCPTRLDEIADMELATPWTGAVAGSVYGQAWDIGYENRAFRRNCSFPTEEWPFICTGVDGTHGVEGARLGNLYYIPLLTNDANPGAGVWTLFAQCWDAVTPTEPDAANSPVSWNVFSLTKTISDGDRALIRNKLSQVGFSTNHPSLLEIAFP